MTIAKKYSGLILGFLFVSIAGLGFGGPSLHSYLVHYDGAPWALKGDGMVCCPCACPCPCRHNSPPTYGHCEALLYLNFTGGHYGSVDMKGVRLAYLSGSCAMSYQGMTDLYFDNSVSPEQQQAFMKIVSSFFDGKPASFPYVQSVPIAVHVTDGHLYSIVIPRIMDIQVDRNWGQPTPPLPWVAATDHFANALQYIENIRYRLHDPAVGVDFDYSHRQANYRVVNLTSEQYKSGSMLIQHTQGNGEFTQRQLAIIKTQHLQLPDLDALGAKVVRLKQEERRRSR
jgi:hypothetical protein